MTATIQFAQPLATESVTGTWQGTVTITRADSEKVKDGLRVFITTQHGDDLIILTPTEAADLAEALHNVSGMACSSRGARFLAMAYRNDFEQRRISGAHAARESGIPVKRLRRFLRGELPITMAEHQSLSEVGA